MKSSFICGATGIKESGKEELGKRGNWNTCFQSQVQKVVGSRELECHSTAFKWIED